MKRIRIGIVTYNRIKRTKKCLERLFQIKGNNKISIADNNSSDGTQEFLIDLYKKDKIDELFLLDKNYGIAPAANVCLETFKEDYYVKMDNDIFIKEDNLFSDMIEIFEKNKNTNLAALSVDFFKEYNQKKYGELPKLRLQSGHVVKRSYRDAGLSGGLVMFPKKVISEFGFWNEDLGLYGAEDTDYGIRLNLGNKKCFYMPGNYATHLHENDPKEYRDFKNEKVKRLKRKDSLFSINLQLYQNNLRSFRKMPRKFITQHNPNFKTKLILNKKYQKEVTEKIEFIKEKSNNG